MTVITQQIKDSIKKAILLEIHGRQFFNHAADITQNERGQKMFRFLAQEEVKHLEVFGHLFSQMLGGDDWKKHIKSSDSESNSPLIAQLQKRLKEKEGKSESEALSLGMQLEREAIEFFQQAAEETNDPVAKKIFLKIIEEEKFHYDLLQTQHDSVTNSGFWLDGAEFQMDGKW